jgi:hypothetical protein
VTKHFKFLEVHVTLNSDLIHLVCTGYTRMRTCKYFAVIVDRRLYYLWCFSSGYVLFIGLVDIDFGKDYLYMNFRQATGLAYQVVGLGTVNST